MAGLDIERALALQPSHVSHYQLTLEPNTVFAASPPPGIPDEDAAWDMQEPSQAMLADAPYAQYEVSAYARPGLQSAPHPTHGRHAHYRGHGAAPPATTTLVPTHATRRRWKPKPHPPHPPTTTT